MASASRPLALFLALLLAILAFQFRDAILRGYVLGQADLLYQFQPWQAHATRRVRLANPLLADSPLVFYPFLAEARRAVLSGRFPLWSAGTYAGHPFFASYQSAVLSPFTAIAYLVPLPEATTVIAAARLAVGGVGMWVFLRALGLGAPAVTFGALAYLLNPFSYVWLEHPLSAVSAWLPWLLAAMRRAARGARARDVALLAIATALALLAGHPETAFKVILFAGAYGAFEIVASRRFVRGSSALTAGLLLGAALAAVQILPFLEYVAESRTLAVRAGYEIPLVNPPAAFITAFVPAFYGNPRWGPYLRTDTNFCEQVGYPSMVAWIFAAVALTRRRDRATVAFFAGAAVLAGLVMYGTPLARLAPVVLPPLKVAVLARFGVVTITSVIVLAAYGVDTLLSANTGGSRWRPWLPAVAATIGAAIVAAIVVRWSAWDHALLVEGRNLAPTEQAVRIAALFASAATAAVWLARVLPRAAAAAAIALVSADLVVFADGFHPLMRKELAYPPLPEVELIRQDRTVFRATGWDDAFHPNVSLVYGVQDFRGYDGLGLAAYLGVLDVGYRSSWATHALVHFYTPHLIDLLNIKYIMVPPGVGVPPERFTRVLDGPVRVIRNDRVQPRAFLVDRVVVLRGDAARRALRGGEYDFRRAAIVDQQIPQAAQPDASDRDLEAARIVEYQDERVVVETDTSGRRLLVLTDVFYPGWKATIDDAPVPIYRTNAAFRGVPVPAGRHVIRFVYDPDSFKWGLYASLAALLVAGALFVGPAAAHRREA